MRTLLTLVMVLLCSVVIAKSYYPLGLAEETLGRGFDSTINMPLDNCLEGDWVFHGNSQGVLNFIGDYESKTLISDIAGSIKGAVNLIIFGGSAKFSMVKKVTKNTNNSGSVIQLQYRKGNYSFENRSLTSSIAKLLKTDPESAARKCGDSFIHNMTLGANLYLSAKLHFRTREEYNWYQRKIKIRFAFWSKTKTKTKESTKSTQNAVYSIRLQADGGVTPTLAKFLERGPMYCKTNAMDPCYKYVAELLGYLVDGGQYIYDLQDSELNTISYDVESYERSGHFELAEAKYGDNQARYIALSDRLRGYQSLVNDILENLYAFIAVAADEAEIKSIQQQINNRLAQQKALNSAADYCFKLPGVYQCETKIEAAIALVD